MDLYTVVMEWGSGTYVAQVRADNEYNALLKWAAQLNVEEIDSLSEEMKQSIIQDLEQVAELYQPVLLNNMSNIWFTGLLVWKKVMYINLIKTAEM